MGAMMEKQTEVSRDSEWGWKAKELCRLKGG